jgi:hypothetical protein
MSQENVEKIREFLATWDWEMLRPQSRPFQRIFSSEVAVALYAPDAIYEDAILPTTFVSHIAASTALSEPQEAG